MQNRPFWFALLFCCSLLPSGAAPLEIIPAELHGAVQPQVAVSPDGRRHVVFGKDNGVYYTSSADGRRFSAPIKIGELDKLALKMRRGPRVTATDKLVLVTAISHADGMLHGWTSADAGKTWRENARLNTVEKSAREGLHAIAGDGHGLVAAVWLDLRGGGMELWGRVSRDGGAAWGGETRIYRSPDGHVCECCVPSVAVGPQGEIAAMWRNALGGARDLYLARSRDAGRTFSPAEKLGAGTWKLEGCPMDGGGLAISPGGEWLAAWRRDRTVYASTSKASETQLASGATQAVVGFVGRTPLKMWESNGALILQRGDGEPARFAEAAGAASLAGGQEKAVVVWEGKSGGAASIFIDEIH